MTVTVTTQSPRKGTRLEFLDAARGIAAFAVMLQHSLEKSTATFLSWSVHHFNLGAFGVVIFFIVSGFIIPVSIERSQTLAAFWSNRFFRLYPIYWVSLVTVLALGYFRLYGLPAVFLSHPVLASMANATMLQVFLRIPDALGVYWTLSLELVFYILCSILFAAGWLHRAILWAWTSVALMTLCVVVTGLGFHRSIPAGRLGLLVTAFVGTTIFRLYSKQVEKKTVYSLLAATLVTLLIGFWFRFHQYPSKGEDGWNLLGVSASWVLAYVLFGSLYALRNRSFPRWILWLGRISYSLYLVHGIVLSLLPADLNPVISVASVIGLSVAISAVTYEFIEKPAIEFHRSRMRERRLHKDPSLATG